MKLSLTQWLVSLKEENVDPGTYIEGRQFEDRCGAGEGKGEYHVTTEEEIGIMCLPPKESQKLLATARVRKETRKAFPLSLQRKHGTDNTLTSDFWPSELRDKKIQWFHATHSVVLCYGSPRKLLLRTLHPMSPVTFLDSKVIKFISFYPESELSAQLNFILKNIASQPLLLS